MRRNAVVTGAGGGIGRAVALRFAQEGMNLMLVDLKEEGLLETIRMAEGFGIEAQYRVADVSDEGAVKEYMETAASVSQLDVVAHCAAIIHAGSLIEEMDTAVCEKIFRVNLLGSFLAIKHSLIIMKRQGEGVIICTGSTNSLLGCPGLGSYSASKHGVMGLIKSAAGENGYNGIRICGVIPGNTDTEMIAEFRDTADQVAKPMCRVARPEEIAESFAFLAKKEASYTNGSILVTNGGLGCCTM